VVIPQNQIRRRLRAEMTWLVVVVKNGEFDIITVGDNEVEARKLAKMLSHRGWVCFWEVKELEAEG